jgi:hypothetical protein
MSTPRVPSREEDLGLTSEAWILRGLSSIPGELMLRGGRLSFTAWGTGSAWPWQLRKLGAEVGSSRFSARIESGDRAQLFDWPLEDTRWWFPWHYFGGGMKIRRGDAQLRLSFGMPANMRLPVRIPGLPTPGSLLHVPGMLKDAGAMRGLGARWRDALSRARPGGEPT